MQRFTLFMLPICESLDLHSLLKQCFQNLSACLVVATLNGLLQRSVGA